VASPARSAPAPVNHDSAALEFRSQAARTSKKVFVFHQRTRLDGTTLKSFVPVDPRVHIANRFPSTDPGAPNSPNSTSRCFSQRTQPSAPPIAILGVPFDNLTIPEAIELVEQMVASRRPHYLVTANVDFLVQARRDVELRRILFDAHLVLCDGTPLLWASKLLGNRLRERVAGSDLVPLLIRIAAEKGYRIFFLGGSAEITAQAAERLQSQHPKLVVAGYYSPPFRNLLEMDHEEIKRRIQEARPDLLFVSFGCPKQEKWLAMHYQKLSVPVAAGVGGTIDFLAGRLSRAPLWMRSTGTEWLFRWAQEPRRLTKRYLRDLWYFGGPLLTQWWHLRFRRSRHISAGIQAQHDPGPAFERVALPERLDMKAVESNAPLWARILANQQPCLLDASHVEFIDSTGVALLIKLQKRARDTAHGLVLIAASSTLRRALGSMRLESFFTFAATEAEGINHLAAQRESQPAVLKPSPVAATQVLVWRDEVTAANAERVWEMTLAYIHNRMACQPELLIELHDLRFVDSSGVGVMVRAKKCARREGAVLRFVGAQDAVRNVIRLSRLEDFLLEQS